MNREYMRQYRLKNKEKLAANDKIYKAENREHINETRRKCRILKKRWEYLKADPDGARALLLLLKNGKGTPDDFDTMVDRIIESRKALSGGSHER